MEQFKSIITESLPPDCEAEREGIKYPKPQKHTYFSQASGRETNVNVLLPPEYSERKKYPVLYILHGFYENEDWMTRPEVSLGAIYGNLLAEGGAREMIIVLPYMFCDKRLPRCTGMNLESCLAYDNFINDLTTGLMPFIEENFSAAKGRENAAITGFSMGGREALFIGFRRPDLFGYIGAVCPAPGLVEIPDSPIHPGQLSAEEMSFGAVKPYVLLISSSDADNAVGSAPADYRRIMTRNNTEYLPHIMKTAGHDHTSVKPHLYNYLRMIF